MASGILLTIHQSSWFCSFQGNFKLLGIGSAEISWGDVKTIKSGKISVLGSDIYVKQNIIYTSASIESSGIGRTLSQTDSKDGSQSNYWNDEDGASDYQLYQKGVDKLFQNSDKVIIRELKLYIEDREKLNINNKIQLSCNIFLSKQGILDLYDKDLDKIFIIDHKQLQFDKKSGSTLNGIPEKPDETLSDNDYFCIHDDIFDINSINSSIQKYHVEFYIK